MTKKLCLTNPFAREHLFFISPSLCQQLCADMVPVPCHNFAHIFITLLNSYCNCSRGDEYSFKSLIASHFHAHLAMSLHAGCKVGIEMSTCTTIIMLLLHKMYLHDFGMRSVLLKCTIF